MTEQQRLARGIALVVSVGVIVLALVLAGPGGGSGGRTSPTDLIYDDLVAAMRQGNVKRYLACFDTQLRAELQTAAQTDGMGKFRESLRQQNQRVTGVAVSNESITGDEAALRLEWVYQTDSDVQQVSLRKVNGRWQISAITTVQRAALPVPYGTEVFPGLATQPTQPPR